MANGTLTLGELNRAPTPLLCGEKNNWLVLLAFWNIATWRTHLRRLNIFRHVEPQKTD
jgi:hypothetical protein